MAGGFQSYSTTPGSNTTINSINIAEGCPASGVNDALRQLAADGASLVAGVPLWCGTSGGAANVQTLTPSPAVLAYATGNGYRFISGFANTTTTPTLNVSGLGAKTIVRPDNTALQVGDIPNGATVDVAYDGTSMRLVTMPTNAVVGFKNAIINGDMRISQRNTSFSSPASGAYTLDRWQGVYDGTGAFTITQNALGVASAPSKFSFRWAQTGALGGSPTVRSFVQRIESVYSFAGQSVTLSFNAQAASGTISVTPSLIQVFGTGGSPSSNVGTTGSAITVDTSGARYTQTFAVPSISGKTLGSNGDDYLQLTFGMPLSGTYTLDVWDVQVERGSFATAFERRPYGTELDLCERYYQLGRLGWLGQSVNAQVYGGTVQFNTTMRAAPTVTFVSSFTASGFPVTTATFNNIGTDGFMFFLSSTGTVTNANYGQTFTAASEL